jgi:hypothetical protein
MGCNLRIETVSRVELRRPFLLSREELMGPLFTSAAADYSTALRSGRNDRFLGVALLQPLFFARR